MVSRDGSSSGESGLIITALFEAGRPVMTFHDPFDHASEMTRTQLVDKIRSLGAGTALEEVLTTPSKLLYRGLRGVTSSIILQDTIASTRSSENTSNYVTLLTEILPSWKRAGILPRSKIVSCTSSMQKASEYGQKFIVLPTDDAQCVYTGAHDFWDAFDGINHVYRTGESIPAINEALGKHFTKIITNSSALVKACEELEVGLDSGKIRIETLNPELRALLNANEETHSVLEILDNLMDPSHMRKTTGGKLLVPGDFHNGGEEVQVGGSIVYVEMNSFVQHFMPPRAN